MDAEHEFADDAYVRRWAETADQRRPERAQMFRHVCELIGHLGRRAPHVVELGCGPGTLGAAVLEQVSDATYEGIDFSRPMLALAAERVRRVGGRGRPGAG